MIHDVLALRNAKNDVRYNENATSSEATEKGTIFRHRNPYSFDVCLTVSFNHFVLAEIREALGEYAYCQFVDPRRYTLSKLKTEGETSDNSNCLFDVSLANGSKPSTFLTQIELPKDIPEIRERIETNTDFYLKYWLASQAESIDKDDYLYFLGVAEEEIENMPNTISKDDVQKYMTYCQAMFFKVADFIP